MKKVVLSLMVLSFVLMSAGTTLAAFSVDTCGILRIGVAGEGDNLFKVTGCDTSANNNKWLQLVKQKDTSMATLLTAFSLAKKVKLNADFDFASKDGSAYGPVEYMYIDN